MNVSVLRPLPMAFAAKSIGARFKALILALQYAQMKKALSILSDTQLDTIGVKRSEISAHARQCIYGGENRAVARENDPLAR